LYGFVLTFGEGIGIGQLYYLNRRYAETVMNIGPKLGERKFKVKAYRRIF